MKKLSFIATALFAAASVLSFLGAGAVKAQSQTPVMGPCTSLAPPALPDTWSANVLLSPSHVTARIGQFTHLAAAKIVYSWSLQRMDLDIYALDGSTIFYTFRGKDYWYRYSTAGQWYGPFQNASWTIPAPTWLAQKGASCRGTQDVLDVRSEWWRIPSLPCTNVPTDTCLQASHADTTNVGSWLWFRQDTGYPWRFMFTNVADFPVLGTLSSMVNFQSFTVISRNNMPPPPDVRNATRTNDVGSTDVVGHLRMSRKLHTGPERQRAILATQTLVPGLKPLSASCQPYRFPAWTNSLKLTGITTPTTALNAYPTAVYYDWGRHGQWSGQLSAFVQQPAGRAAQCISNNYLTQSNTFADVTDVNGRIMPNSCSFAIKDIGMPVPKWPSTDKCSCSGVISGQNTVLSKGGDTIIFNCPSGHDSFFWHWFYANSNVPRVFMETPQPCQVTFALIDYYSVVQNGPIDPNLIQVPLECRNAKAPPVEPGQAACNHCHNK